MEFWLGAHHPSWLKTEDHLFVSRRALFEMKRLPPAVGTWALDSGGFTELSLFGEWRTTEDQYVADVLRFAEEMSGLAWAAPMDWMCEPFMLAKTGLPMYEHQMRTVQNFLRLRERLGELVIPVLQGWHQDDYHRCWDFYAKCGVDLETEPIVGIGSVCRRQNTKEADRIFRSLRPLRMHGFGVKLAGLDLFHDVLTSCDSMAWSWEARRLGRRHDRQDQLFAWPKVMLCGRVHPDEHPAKSCANCRHWAMRWRDRVLERLEVAA